MSVRDGKDASGHVDMMVDDTITVTVTVDDVDEPPDIELDFTGVGVSENDNNLTVHENHMVPLATYRASDPEGEDPLTYDWSVTAADFSSDFGDFVIDQGVLSFAEIPDYELPADFNRDNEYFIRVSAPDKFGNTGSIDVTVTVLRVNEAPVITGEDEHSVEEEGVVFVGEYGATDPEGATIAWLPLAGDDAGNFRLTNGRLEFKVAPDYEDPDRHGLDEYGVRLSVSDGVNPPTLLDVAVTVTNKDEPGMLALPTTQPQVDADYTATLSDADGVESTDWTWERSTSRSGPWTAVSGSVNSTATSSVYTPVTGDVGYYLRASAAYTDGEGPNKSPRNHPVSMDPVRMAPLMNEAPVFGDRNPARSVGENAGANDSVGDPVTATDSDSGDTVRYEFELPLPDLFTINSGDGQIRVKADESLDHETAPSHTVTVKALDTSNEFDTVQVTIEVTNVNEPPEAEDDRATVAEDASVTIDVLDNDNDQEQDRSELLLTVVTPPVNGSAMVNPPANVGENRTISYAPNDDYNGADTFTYRVEDTGSFWSSASVAINVIAVNDAPEFREPTTTRSVSESAEAGANVGAPVTATDVDEHDTLTYSLSGADASSFEIDSKGQITVGPGTKFAIATRDTYTVTVEVDDGSNEPNATAIIDVTINVVARRVGPPIFTGGGGGGGGPSGPTPSDEDFEWTVTHDIEELDSTHDKPSGMWSDGTTLWLLENGDGADDAVYAYDLESGERVEEREFELDERNRAPRGLWSDRTVIWISDSGQNRLFAHDLETGARLMERDVALAERNRDARGIWSDEQTMWVLDGGKNSLFAYDLESGELLAEYALASTNGDPRGIWSDDVTVWVSDHGAKRLLAYRLPARPEAPAAEDAEPQDIERVIDEEFKELSRASNNSPRGIWSDGDVMYVADESDGKVYSYNMPNAIDTRLASLTLSGIDIGEFDPGAIDYEGVPGEGVIETTVEAAAMQRRTNIEIDPPDADEAAEGHQVALEGVDAITVTVTSADGSRERIYRARLRDPERPAASGPTSRCLRGDVATGFSLLIYEGGSLEDLVVCALSRHIVAIYVLNNGVYVPYIVGAPDFVNRSFYDLYPDGVLPLTPLVAATDGPPSADTAVDRLAEDELATLRGSNCLYGEIAAGFSLTIFEGGSVGALEACGRSLGIAAFYALHQGEWVSYILGAPEFANQPFRELFAGGLAALTPLVAKGEGATRR